LADHRETDCSGVLRIGLNLRKRKRIMKHNRTSWHQPQAASTASVPTDAVAPPRQAINVAPSVEDVARRAYFTYLNEGSPEGQQEKHWLEAESHLCAEIARGAQTHRG